MYQHHISAFGTFEKHTLHNPDTGNSLEIVPDFGAILLAARFADFNVIDGYSTPEELVEQKWGKSIVLYPFPNRMDEGKYTFEGKSYQFPINNEATNNAIHGLGRTRAHRASSVITAANYASITCSCEYEGDEEYYPFPFRFDVEYFISDGNAVEVKMQFTNTGVGNLPVGIGWHPYFSLSENIEDTAMQCPELHLIDITERMLPTGKKTAYADFTTLRKIDDTNLDNGFYIANQDQPFGVSLESAKGRLRYWQETGSDKYNFIQIFTPSHRASIALEPMTCNVNAFNNQDGLKILAAGDTLGGNFGFTFSKI